MLFDQASVGEAEAQCVDYGGGVFGAGIPRTAYFPPSTVVVYCKPPGGTSANEGIVAAINSSNCDDLTQPSPQPPGNPPGAPNSCQQGSIIMVEKKSVGETVNILGTPYSLNYMSHKASRPMDRMATLSFIPNAESFGTSLSIRVGNSRTFTYNYNPGQITSGFKQPFTWDGLDENGNVVLGSTVASAHTVYTFPGGNTGPISTFQLFYLRPLDFKKMSLGGWTLNVHHFYDITERVIYYGDGTDAFAPGGLNATADTFQVSSKDNSELFEFSTTTQRHLRTLFGTKGTTKYTFNYNANGSLISVVDYNGLQTTIQRDPVSDAPTSITGPYGHVTTLQINATGNLSRIQFGSFETHLMAYQNDLLRTYKNPRGVVTTFTYDSIGRLIKDQSAAGSSVDLSFLNLDNGTSTTTTSAMGFARNYTTSIISDTDRSILSTKKTIPTMQPTEMHSNIYLGNYVLSSNSDDVGGLSLSHFNVDPRTRNPYIADTSYRFGLLNNVATEYRSVQLNAEDNLFDIANYTKSFVNNSHVNGEQTSTLTYDGALSSYIYTSPLSRQTKVTVDNFERPTQYQFATDHPVSLAYDSQGRLSQVSQSNRATLYRYSSLGNIANIRNALGQITRFTHDRSGKMTSQTLPDGRQTLFTYDKNNNLTSVTPPGKPTQVLTYNNFDLLSGYLTTNPTTWNYDNDRKITSMVRPDGAIAQYNYNTATARLTSIATPQGSYTINNNPDWNLIDSVTSPDNVQETFAYTAGLLTSIQMQGPTTGQWSRTINNDFDTATSLVQNGTSINYVYDNDSDLIQVGDLNITRNVTNGRITRTQLNRIYENKNYTAFGELSALKNRYQNSRIYQDYKFTRDRLGRISQKIETLEGTPQSTFNYIYDTSGRLTSVQKNGAAVLSQVFDSNSNRTQVTENGSSINATYDSKDQILTWGTLQFTHNLNGELITITDSANLPAGSTNFTYNVFGHLKSVTLPNGSQINYLLDAFNRRVGKRVNNILTKQFLWQDELKIAAEYDGSGNLVSEFIYAQSVNAPDYMIRGGIKYKLVKDNLGSILAVVNAANGAPAQQLTYSTYGKVLSDSNPGFQPFGFAGGLYDSDTKLVRFGAREYNGAIGRWMTKDPILFNGGDTNVYGYVLQDPVNYWDPNGHSAWRLVPIILAGGYAVQQLIKFAWDKIFPNQEDPFRGPSSIPPLSPTVPRTEPIRPWDPPQINPNQNKCQ